MIIYSKIKINLKIRWKDELKEMSGLTRIRYVKNKIKGEIVWDE